MWLNLTKKNSTHVEWWLNSSNKGAFIFGQAEIWTRPHFVSLGDDIGTVCLFDCVYLTDFLSLCQTVSLFDCPSIWKFFCLSVWLPVCLSVNVLNVRHNSIPRRWHTAHWTNGEALAWPLAGLLMFSLQLSCFVGHTIAAHR